MFNDDDDDLDITEIDPALLDGKAPVSSQNTGEKDDRTINHKDSVKTEPVSRSQRCMFHCVLTVVFLCYAKNNIRDLKQRRRRRQGRRLEKNEFIFYRRISHMPRSVQYVYRSQNLLKLNMQCQGTIPKENTKNKPPSLTFSKIPRTWSFHVVVLQRTAKKCTKNYNARAQLLFCSLNLLFCGVLVAVAVVVCLSP